MSSNPANMSYSSVYSGGGVPYGGTMIPPPFMDPRAYMEAQIDPRAGVGMAMTMPPMFGFPQDPNISFISHNTSYSTIPPSGDVPQFRAHMKEQDPGASHSSNPFIYPSSPSLLINPKVGFWCLKLYTCTGNSENHTLVRCHNFMLFVLMFLQFKKNHIVKVQIWESQWNLCLFTPQDHDAASDMSGIVKATPRQLCFSNQSTPKLVTTQSRVYKPIQHSPKKPLHRNRDSRLNIPDKVTNIEWELIEISIGC